MPQTLAKACLHQEIIQKSRFITQASPIQSPEEAQAFIQNISDLSATHNCWAWKLGQQYRFSDDGEPGGTAGRPMLTAIEGQDFDQVVVVVTRFFGGIKLGTGGLARAYGGCTARCLQAGIAQPLVSLTQGQCHCRFSDIARIKAKFPELETHIANEAFDAEGVFWTLAFPQAHFEHLQKMLSDLSRGHSLLKQLN